MPKFTLTIGLLLSLLGIGFYVLLGVLSGSSTSATALIPTFVGLPILLAGALALKSTMRKTAMHTATVFALIGFVLPSGRLMMQLAKGTDFNPAATTSLVLMASLSCALLIACVKSFVETRQTVAKPQ